MKELSLILSNLNFHIVSVQKVLNVFLIFATDGIYVYGDKKDVEKYMKGRKTK